MKYENCITRCKADWEADTLTKIIDKNSEKAMQDFCQVAADEELGKNPEEKKA